MPRVQIRADAVIMTRLRDAAELSGVSVSEFIISAAVEKSDAVISRETTLKYSLEDAKLFINLLDFLDEPSNAGVLERNNK